MTDLAQRLINAANCVGYGGSLNGGAVHKELLNECRYALEAKDIEIKMLRAAHRRFFTNTTHGVTMQDRNFALQDFVICDENFDYDAALEVSGDFPEGDKEKYAQMICGVLNSHMKLKDLCDQLGEALEEAVYSNSTKKSQELSDSALAAWRNSK